MCCWRTQVKYRIQRVVSHVLYQSLTQPLTATCVDQMSGHCRFLYCTDVEASCVLLCSFQARSFWIVEFEKRQILVQFIGPEVLIRDWSAERSLSPSSRLSSTAVSLFDVPLILTAPPTSSSRGSYQRSGPQSISAHTGPAHARVTVNR